MLTRLYANNYGCLVGFTINFQDITLLLGPNGGGKSTVFDLLQGLRGLIADNEKIEESFPIESLTAWSDNPEQTFELDINSEYGLLTYRLVIRHSRETRKQQIIEETLSAGDRPFFEFNDGEVKLFTDTHTFVQSYSHDRNLSALATTGSNHIVQWFKERVTNFFMINLQPKTMDSWSDRESDWFRPDGKNFASWYRNLENCTKDKIQDKLHEVLLGFDSLRLVQKNQLHFLEIGFCNGRNRRPVFLDFRQLSDGQRILIVLYSLLIGLRNLGNTLFIEEPENYLALSEIQPWLVELRDTCGEAIPQAVLISHHPEIIDYLGPDCGKWIEREPLGPTREKKMPQKIDGGLKLSEMIARGWTD